MRNRITPCIMSAMVFLPLLQSFSAYSENKADRGTLTVTFIDEETNELFVEDRDCFEINGDSIRLDSWNPSKSNPHTVTDVQTKFEYAVQYVGKEYDGYTYYIDTEKSDSFISFTDDTVKELTVYMKKNSWSNNNTPTESIDTVKTITGDVNNDGEFNISDVVILQKWLLAVPDTELVNWKAADLCEDDKLDVFDLCLMKRTLIEKNNESDQNVDAAFSLHSVTDIYDGHEAWNGYIVRSENELNDIIAENERMSAQDIIIEGIDKDFFNDKSLVVIYSPSRAGNQYTIIDDMTLKGNTINISTITKRPMIAIPSMLYRRYIYCIDKKAIANADNITFNDASDVYQFEEEKEVVEWYKEWMSNFH